MKHNLQGEYIICDECGKAEYTPDYYAQNSKKWCRECADIKYHEQLNERMRQYRKRAREKRAEERTEVDLLRQQNGLLKAEIENLKYLVKAQREQIEEYVNPEYSRSSTAEGKNSVDYLREQRRKKNYFD